MTDTVDTSKEAVAYDEQYDTVMDVQQDPTGAMWAIHSLQERLDQALARERALLDSNKEASDYLRERDQLRREVEEARDKMDLMELAGKEAAVLAWRAAIDKAREICMEEAREFIGGTEIDECSKIALHDAAARILALKVRP